MALRNVTRREVEDEVLVENLLVLDDAALVEGGLEIVEHVFFAPRLAILAHWRWNSRIIAACETKREKSGQQESVSVSYDHLEAA
jgi:hypothetical protein